jgi:hypothetical protein
MKAKDDKMATEKLIQSQEFESHELQPSSHTNNYAPMQLQNSHTSVHCNDLTSNIQDTNLSSIVIHNAHLHIDVPLASMDDFSDNGNSVQSHTSSRLSLNSDTETDGSYSALKSSKTESESDTIHRASLNGPNHIRHQLSWIEKGIQSTEDLERIFVKDTSDNLSQILSLDGTDESYCTYDLLDFAEKYFNVHYLPTSGPSAAITKTVNFVKRRPNLVRGMFNISMNRCKWLKVGILKNLNINFLP